MPKHERGKSQVQNGMPKSSRENPGPATIRLLSVTSGKFISMKLLTNARVTMRIEPSPELAEFFGIMLGDGCLGIYKSTSGGVVRLQHRVKITMNSEDDMRYAQTTVIPLIRNLFSVRPLLRKRNEENTIDILVFGKEIVNALKRIGLRLSPKRDRAMIASWIFSYGFELYTLRGLFDTDGCVVFDKQHRNVPYYPRLELKVSSTHLRDQIAEILRDHGFRYSTSMKTGSNTFKFQINGAVFFKKWAIEIGFNNPKHTAKYMFWSEHGYFLKPTFYS